MKKPVFTLLCSYEKLYEMQAPYSRVCAGPDPANIGPIRVICGINFENIPICIRVDFILLSVHCAGYTEITHAPSLHCCARNIFTVLRETLTQYITIKEGGDGILYYCIR